MPGRPAHPVQPDGPARAVRTPPRHAPSPRSPLHPSVRPATGPHDDPAGDVVRWAAFSCLLVPVVLVVYGTSFGGAAVATLGLAVVTAACRVMLRHTEKLRHAEKAQRAAARERERVPAVHRGRRPHGGTGSHGGCHGSGAAPSHD